MIRYCAAGQHQSRLLLRKLLRRGAILDSAQYSTSTGSDVDRQQLNVMRSTAADYSTYLIPSYEEKKSSGFLFGSNINANNRGCIGRLRSASRACDVTAALNVNNCCTLTGGNFYTSDDIRLKNHTGLSTAKIRTSRSLIDTSINASISTLINTLISHTNTNQRYRCADNRSYHSHSHSHSYHTSISSEHRRYDRRGTTFECRQFSSKINDINRQNEEKEEEDDENEEAEGLTELRESEGEGEEEEEELPLKTYYRAKQLVTILKKKQEEIYKEFTLRHKKRFYTFQDGVFYEFSSSKEIIIDEDAILKSKNERNKNLLRNSKKETRRDYVSSEKHEKTPVIVILGHFNHGKTTLLDALGKLSIVEKEAHGITQEIRTCHVHLRTDKKEAAVTFIDTPGQDIFFRMRNYGVSVADMVLLVVSLEDGVCSQTEESIGAVETILQNYYDEENEESEEDNKEQNNEQNKKKSDNNSDKTNEKTSNSKKQIPIIVCLNKMDSTLFSKIDLNERIAEVENNLREYNVLENAIFLPISAKIGTNLNLLKETIISVANDHQERTKIRDKEKDVKMKNLLLNMKADRNYDGSDERNAYHNNSSSNGVLLDVIKSRKLGTTLHAVIREGQVKEGDYFAAGGWSGKIKRISHENGDSKANNRNFENGRVPIAETGWGVRLNVTMNSLCDEPSPLGDEILFFSADGTESYKKLVEASRIMNAIRIKNLENSENSEKENGKNENGENQFRENGGNRESGEEGNSDNNGTSVVRDGTINIDIFGNNNGDSIGVDNKRKNSSNSIFNNNMNNNIRNMLNNKNTDKTNKSTDKNNRNADKNDKNNKNNNDHDNDNNNADLDITIDSTDEFSSTTLRQHQKYLIAYSKEADQLASDFADRLRMTHSIGSFAMTDEAADKMRLPQMWAIVKSRNNKRKKSWAGKGEMGGKGEKVVKPVFYDEDGKRIEFDEGEDEDEGEGEDDMEIEAIDGQDGENDDDNSDDDYASDSDEDNNSDSDGDESKEMQAMRLRTEENNERIKANNKREEEIMQEKDRNKKKNQNVMVRTLSDVFLSTIMDCLQEEEEYDDDDENYKKFEREKEKEIEKLRKGGKAPILPLSVISAGIGEITAKDIMIAGSANATIITYCLPLNSDSQKLAQERGVRIVAFDKFEDIINIIKGGLTSELLELAKANLKPPQKKKKQKKKK